MNVHKFSSIDEMREAEKHLFSADNQENYQAPLTRKDWRVSGASGAEGGKGRFIIVNSYVLHVCAYTNPMHVDDENLDMIYHVLIAEEWYRTWNHTVAKADGSAGFFTQYRSDAAASRVTHTRQIHVLRKADPDLRHLKRFEDAAKKRREIDLCARLIDAHIDHDRHGTPLYSLDFDPENGTRIEETPGAFRTFDLGSGNVHACPIITEIRRADVTPSFFESIYKGAWLAISGY